MAGLKRLRPTPAQANLHFAFGSVAMLLILLNLLTPSLLSGATSGTFLGEGDLYVTAPNSTTLAFVIETEGHVEFAKVVVAVNLSAPSTVGNATTLRHWDLWYNASNVVAATFNVTSVSFVVNVTAWYAPGSVGGGNDAPAATIGTFDFQLSGSGSALAVVVTPIYPLLGTGALPGGGGPLSWQYADLPWVLPLAQPPATATGPVPSFAPFPGGAP